MHSWNKIYLVVIYYSFYVPLDSICNVLIRFGYQSYAGIIKQAEKMLSFFYSLEEFVIFSLNVWKNLLVKLYEPIVFLMVEKI